MSRDPEGDSVHQARLQRAILVIRGCNVILDVELAELYGVPTRALNQAVKRNSTRFPSDFMFTLTAREKAEVVTICDHLPNLKFSPTLPNVFTEHGALMATNVLNSDRAVEMSVHLVRTFVRLREAAGQYQELADRLRQAEKRIGLHDTHLAGIVRKIREMAEAPPAKKTRRIGFVVSEEDE
jgi:hypothetical protein